MWEANDIIELVFEEVRLEKTVELLTRMLKTSKLKGYTIATESSEIDLQSERTISNSIDQSSGGAFYFRFLNFNLKDISLSEAGFQILKYDDNIYDLNLHFERNELNEKASLSALQKSAESLAKDLEATKYYCGYEPAADEDTRLFTGGTLGPINIWRNIDQERRLPGGN